MGHGGYSGMEAILNNHVPDETGKVTGGIQNKFG
jgi:hypothetical protein